MIVLLIINIVEHVLLEHVIIILSKKFLLLIGAVKIIKLQIKSVRSNVNYLMTLT